MKRLEGFQPDHKRPQKGGRLARNPGILVKMLPTVGVPDDVAARNRRHLAFLMDALDIKRNYIRPACRREAIRIVRDVLKLNVMSGVDLHKVWPSLRSGPISHDPDDYVLPVASGPRFPMSKYIKLTEQENEREPQKRGVGTPWFRKLFSNIPELGKQRMEANDSVRNFVNRSTDDEATEILPKYRRAAIDLLANVLHLDPNVGGNILKVWPHHVDRPISTDPADYVPFSPAERAMQYRVDPLTYDRIRRSIQPAAFPMSKYIKLTKEQKKRPAENRGSGTDWSRLIFSTAPDYIGEERAKANKSVRSFIRKAADEEATEIKPEFRRAAIDLLANVLHLDPNVGGNILKVWPYHVDRPISTDPADYIPLRPVERPYTVHPKTQAIITPNA